jgi:hypothetical protein
MIGHAISDAQSQPTEESKSKAKDSIDTKKKPKHLAQRPPLSNITNMITNINTPKN